MKTNLIRNTFQNIITKPRFLGPAVFLGVGGVKTCCDYHKAPHERKTRVLLKDTAILAGSAAAFAVVSPLTRAFCNTRFVDLSLKAANKLISKFRKPLTSSNRTTLGQTEKFMQNTEHVLKEAVAGTINTFAGILGAVYSNEFMHKYVFSKPPFYVEPKQETLTSQNIKIPSSNVFKSFNYVNNEFTKATANKMFSTLSDLPEMKLLEKPMIALTGFSVANTKGYHNKLKKTTYELLANTLIPTIFVSAMSLAVQNKKPMIKYPALFTALTIGAVTGTVAADKMKERINNTIDSIDMKYIVV